MRDDSHAGSRAPRRGRRPPATRALHLFGQYNDRNSSLARHIETMLEEVDEHAAAYGLGVTTHIATPSLAMQFAVSTIGRGTLVRTVENGVRAGKRTRACATYVDPSSVN
ncbi:hypothetical protein [Paraburkholderia sp. EG304]|uniref:hypothetical protein n=1 Tax=Paraburkholderia sp. EG304 TaxID=3237015 RepID=UPI00397DF05E